jgi:hypothetical protein
MRLNNATGPDAGGAYSSSLMGSVDNGPNSLKIGVPPPLRDVMSMADVVAKQWTLPTNITACCHDDLLKDFSKTPNYSKFLALGSKPKSKASPVHIRLLVGLVSLTVYSQYSVALPPGEVLNLC